MRQALIALVSVSLTLSSMASRAQTGFDRGRLFFGGNFGMRFGNSTFVNLSPQAGYRLTDRFALGGGINCIASSLTFRSSGGTRLYRESSGFAGLNAFARLYPIQSVFLSAQPEYNYSWGKVKYFNGQPDAKTPGVFVPCFLVGAGTVIPSGRGSLIAMLQYDIAGSARSPYGRSPFVSFGFNF
jgi:hypothetical protein